MRNTLPREESTYEIFILDWKRKSWNKHFGIHIPLCHQMKGEIRCGLIINIITYVFIDTVGIPTHDCIYRIYWKYNLCRVSLYLWWWNHNEVPLPGYKKRPFFFFFFFKWKSLSDVNTARDSFLVMWVSHKTSYQFVLFGIQCCPEHAASALVRSRILLNGHQMPSTDDSWTQEIWSHN